MPTLRALLFIALTALAGPALAQEAIERQMTPQEFSAAGLDKLSAAELAQLNAWLNRTVATETAKAAQVAKQQVVDDNRGFFSFGTLDPINARIAGEFRGFARGRRYTMENGQVWRQVDDASLSSVRLSSPEVRITPARVGNVWYMAVKGYNTRAKVERVQ